MVSMDSQPEQTQEQQTTVIPAIEQWDDATARDRAKGDFEYAEKYRLQNHDYRYKTSMRLYAANVDKKTWEGTRIPRSSVSVWMLYGQSEALMSQLIDALLSDDPPFSAEAMPGTTADQARKVVALLRQQFADLDECDSSYGLQLRNKTLRELLKKCEKDKQIFGNGIIEVGWYKNQIEKEVWSRVEYQEKAMQMNAMGGQFLGPTGRTLSRPDKQRKAIAISKPVAKYLDIRDCYYDPHCTSPAPQAGRYFCARSWPTIYEVLEMAKIENVMIPDVKELYEFVTTTKKTAEADNDKTVAEAYRGGAYTPSNDYTKDPGNKRVELVRYFTKDRIVWMLSRKKVIYNQPNPYNVIPFLGAAFSDFPGRAYGMSMSDVVEGDQKLAEAILNARIDELNLLIHPPIIKKRGLNMPGSMQKLRPGVVWEADDPKNDYVRMEMGNVTAQAFVEMDALERRVQKTTGVTDLAALGTPSAGGNSANRTATGVNSQVAATGKRVQYQVTNTEDQVMLPLVNAFYSMDKMFLDPNEVLRLVPPGSVETEKVDPLDILNADVRFLMTASNKMKSRQALASGGLQAIMQAYFNPGYIQGLAQMGLGVNYAEIDKLVCDTMGLPVKSLINPMSPQQMQQMMQQNTMKEQIKSQMQDNRLQAQGEHAESKSETQLLITLLNKILTPETSHAILDQLGLDAPLKLSQQAAAPKPQAGA